MPFQRRGGFDERQRRGTGTRAPALCARVLRSEYQALTRAVPDPRSPDRGVLFSRLGRGEGLHKNWLRGFWPRNVDDARRAGYVMLRREGDFILLYCGSARGHPSCHPLGRAPSARRVTGNSLLLFLFLFSLGLSAPLGCFALCRRSCASHNVVSCPCSSPVRKSTSATCPRAIRGCAVTVVRPGGDDSCPCARKRRLPKALIEMELRLPRGTCFWD